MACRIGPAGEDGQGTLAVTFDTFYKKKMKGGAEVRESIDGRRLNGAGYLIEVARLCGRHKILRKPCAKGLLVVQL